MSASLTPAQHKQIMACLVGLRIDARIVVRTMKVEQQNVDIHKAILDQAICQGDRKAEALAKIDLDTSREALMEIDFMIIEVGNLFSQCSRLFDQLPRQDWLRALSVNESEWHTPDMLKYGESITSVVGVLDLENSATKDDDITVKPLKWCQTMTMFSATRTNLKLGEFMHDKCNEMLDGVFGDFKPPSLMERLGVRT